MAKLDLALANMYAFNAGFRGDALKIVIAIAQAESGLDSNAVNCNNPGNSCDRGILQINNSWHSEVTDQCAYDPICAFKEAYRISSGGMDFTPWTTFINGSFVKFLKWENKMLWYEYPIAVPFGDTRYDVAMHGSHDMTFMTPPNTEITQLVSGVVSDISYPSWGAQVCIKLDEPVEGHDYFAILHLAAVREDLVVGMHMQPLEIVGWSGGCTSADQYKGTSNPTGMNFLNTLEESSQPQTGIALHDGPAYGGLGWSVWPPVDTSLDPWTVVENFVGGNSVTTGNVPLEKDPREQQAHLTWIATDALLKAGYKQSADETSDIHAFWLVAYMSTYNAGPPITPVLDWEDWSGNRGKCQWFLHDCRIEDVNGLRAMYNGKNQKVFS